MSNLINQNMQSLRAQIDEIVKDLHELTLSIGNDSLAKTVSDLRNRIHEPFMFVIVGEVKSGKSSFINALLDTGREITKVAPQPMTDTIQQILYGEEEEILTINPYLKKILLPVDILREIAIVDTPGTNTIVEHHEEITESFIPASDLIVFVFEAKNPYRQSAWAFFDYIHQEWRRKVIFVLQQKDLMSEEDLAVNFNGVVEHARKKGLESAVVFAVSAKQEEEGLTDHSGFKPIREYIQKNITGGKAPILKMQNNIATSQNINERIAEGLNLRRAQWEADLAFRRDITGTLDHQENRSSKQVDVLVENMLAGYDRITRRMAEELGGGLGFFSLLKRSLSSIFSRKTSAKEWLDGLAVQLETDLHHELNQKLQDGIGDLADNIQQMARLIDLKIRNSQTILRNDHEIFSDIAERRSNVLQELQEAFQQFINRTESFADADLFPDKKALSPNLAAGSGLAVIGIILTAVTNYSILDITGGVLSAIGLLFAGVSTRVKRRKILDGFQAEISKGRERLSGEVEEKLKTYIHQLRQRIDGNFKRFDDLLEREEKQIADFSGRQQEVTERLAQLQVQLSGM